MAVIQIVHNPVVARVIGADSVAKLAISNLVSYHVEGYEQTDAYKEGKWDGCSSFFDYRTESFPAGFVPRVVQMLTNQGHMVSITRTEVPAPLGAEKPVVDNLPESDRYDYQMQTVRELEKRKSMIARIATGGGKSRIAKLCIARLQRRTLFMTTRQALMYQMGKSLDASGFDTGYIGDGTWEPGKEVTCAMVQTLIERLKKPNDDDNSPKANKQRRTRQKTIEFLETVEFVIGEEAHEAGGESYYDLLRHCKRANWRLALTATPFMRGSMEANMRLMASFGEIGINVSEKMLIDRGILAKPYFKIVQTPTPTMLRRTTPWQRAVDVGIIKNEVRNRHICAEAIRGNRYGMSIMILVQRKSHGAALEEILRRAGVRVRYIFGESKTNVREEALEQLGRGDIDVLIGSTILDVGVDVPAVGMIILAGGGKAEVAHRQRIGRGLREKKVGPNVCLVVDFSDRGNKHLEAHARTRRHILEKTPGFAENILPAGSDFNFAALGFTPVSRAA